jgi:chondroitin 4-sulfotransferase 11
VISHEYECIFVHQRKCAGTSICCAFDVPWARDCPTWHFMDEGVNSPDAGLYPDYYRFSVVRNPYDRFVSGWKFCDHELGRESTLEEVLGALSEYSSPGSLGRDESAWLYYSHLVRPQHELLFRPDGSLGVDYVMRFEALQEDFDHVCDAVGKPRRMLSHVNPSRREPYRHYFDADPGAREVVARHFARDLDLFDYRY